MTGHEQEEIDRIRKIVNFAASDTTLKKQRKAFAKYSSDVFSLVGEELLLLGHIVGPDRSNGVSPFGHGSDEVVAISVLFRIASQLISASADLFLDGRKYAAAALLRQMVEIEYLAWAMDTRDKDAERWLRSDREQRQNFFAPAKLRKAAEGKFRGEDYGYHCELGGHPVPTAGILLDGDSAVAQLLLSDLLGHVGGIWNHLASWATRNSSGGPITTRNLQMCKKFNAWRYNDPLADLPPPP